MGKKLRFIVRQLLLWLGLGLFIRVRDSVIVVNGESIEQHTVGLMPHCGIWNNATHSPNISMPNVSVFSFARDPARKRGFDFLQKIF